MAELAANLTAVKNETFYTNDELNTVLTSVKNEVIYVNPHPVPPNPVDAQLSTTKLEILYGGMSTTQLTTVKTEILRSVANTITYGIFTASKHEVFYVNTNQPVILTSVKKEVLFQPRGIYASATLTAVKHEAVIGGRNPCKLTSTKKEVLRSLVTATSLHPRRLLVLWNPEEYGK